VTGGASVSDEQGLLGLAFDPDYATNGQFYVYYTGSGTNNVARYTVSANPNVANTTGVIMMTWTDPFTNHNGGWMDFGPDGNLYISTGDGGSANDPGNRAQNLTDRNGKIHRIKPTVGGASPFYTVPASNPFIGGASTADDTVWAYGLRNAWRCSFDRETGDLWIADVGQNAVEEINFQPGSLATDLSGDGRVDGADLGALLGAWGQPGASDLNADGTTDGSDLGVLLGSWGSQLGGRNYGWRCTEGTSSTGLSGCTFGSPTLTAPIHTYNHVSGSTGGYSLTGGYVYRGCRIPDLQGTYFFADYVSANIWTFRYNAATNTKSQFQNRNSTLGTSAEGGVVNQYAAFGEDANGELYIADHGGQIYKIIPASGDGPCAP
jgi:glucose/arabinose dehydrogenase